MRTRIIPIALAATLACAVVLSACGGSGSASSTPPTPSGQSSPTFLSAGDAPMSSVIRALVTISAISATDSTGKSVALLSQATQIELTHLGGIRAPLKLAALPFGTYNSVSLTVSAAQITYIDSTGAMQTADATIANGGVATATLTPALTVNDAGATDLRFDFDLQKSLDLTGTTVTFTPTIGAIVARVKDEHGDHDDRIHIDGTVTATSTSANTITLTTLDTGLSVTLNVTGQTKFGDGLSLASVQTGATLHTVDQLNDDGSITALHVEDADGSPADNGVDNGIITAVASSNNVVSSFQLFVRNSDSESNEDKTITVTVNSATDIKTSDEATEAGLTTFDQTQLFPGQAVWVAGTKDTTAATATVIANKIRPAQINPFGLTTAVPTQITGGLAISLLISNQDFFDHFAQISGTIAVDTNSSTVFDGNGLNATNAATLASNSSVIARGFLQAATSNGVTSYTLFCSNLHETH